MKPLNVEEKYQYKCLVCLLQYTCCYTTPMANVLLNVFFFKTKETHVSYVWEMYEKYEKCMVAYPNQEIYFLVKGTFVLVALWSHLSLSLN